jgi:flagellar motility protein MotE (MotC chaperone)
MKPMLAHTLLALGGTTLFVGSFVGFAVMSGTPVHEIAVLKNFVRPPKETKPAQTPSSDDPQHESARNDAASEHADTKPAKSDKEVLAGSVGVLGSFLLPSPFTTTELASLQAQLQANREDLQKRLSNIEAREGELDEWEHALDQRMKELATARTALDKRELDLKLSVDEIERDKSAKGAREKESWKEIAKFFATGDPSELALKLAEFSPKEAVHILRALDDERASELVNALPTEKYHVYLEAYRALSE